MEKKLDRLHGIAFLLGSLTHAAEKNMGKGSLSSCALAGKKFGEEAVEGTETTDDPVRAVRLLSDALKKRGIVWDFEPFQGDQETMIEERDGARVIRLVFHTCMVRNALFRYAHEQKLSLCYMSHGVFAGAMEKIMPGKTCHLDILHAGPNACLKELVIEETK
ncbi:hypothetical protein CSA37_00960 [Candidatus Fermentibacteria bacterium]|nr:MAG: hypothetical protein CSA37_00960 [Candidatus Fermentibacteria bacterium]